MKYHPSSLATELSGPASSAWDDIMAILEHGILGTPVVPFFPFYLGVSLFKLNIRKRVPLLFRGYWGIKYIMYTNILQVDSQGALDDWYLN